MHVMNNGSWSLAEKYCVEIDHGHLWSINSDEEWNAVYHHTNKDLSANWISPKLVFIGLEKTVRL